MGKSCCARKCKNCLNLHQLCVCSGSKEKKSLTRCWAAFNRTLGSMLGEVIIPLWSTSVRPNVQVKHGGIPVQVHQGGQGWENWIYEERLRPGLAQPGREPRRDLIAAYSYKMGDHTEDRARLFSKVYSKRMRGNRHMLQQREL